MEAPRAAIRTDGLSRHFGPNRAVDALSVDVPQGSIFGFLGPNGAGKTTTINLLLGLLEPTSGHAEVLGFDPWRAGDDVRHRTGAVLEDAGVYEQLSAEDNLEFYGRAWQLPPGERRTRIGELLKQADLWDRRGEKAGTWSHGMRQRLALARALLHRPSLLFLDEPTVGLDVMTAAAVRDDLAMLPSREGVTVFLTTHNMAEAERLCQLVAVIRSGRLLAVGSPKELRGRTTAPRMEITGRAFSERALAALRVLPEVQAAERRNGQLVVELADGAQPAAIIRTLVGAGAEIDEARQATASLEDVFVTLMEEER